MDFIRSIRSIYSFMIFIFLVLQKRHAGYIPLILEKVKINRDSHLGNTIYQCRLQFNDMNLSGVPAT